MLPQVIRTCNTEFTEIPYATCTTLAQVIRVYET